MNHRVFGKKLGRSVSHRKSLLVNLCVSLILHDQIKTTVTKAKMLRPEIEGLLTRAKNPTLHNRRMLFASLGNNQEAVDRLIEVVATRSANRNGGYTRIIKGGRRYGDCAPVAYIEFVDWRASLELK